MQKDLKIGIISGLVLVALAAIWLSTRPSLSTKARMLRPSSQNTGSLQQPVEQPRFVTNLPHAPSAGTTTTNHQIPDIRFHIVRKGETLSEISYRYYGSANEWQKILDANREIIKDARKLIPGTKLIIPE